MTINKNQSLTINKKQSLTINKRKPLTINKSQSLTINENQLLTIKKRNYYDNSYFLIFNRLWFIRSCMIGNTLFNYVIIYNRFILFLSIIQFNSYNYCYHRLWTLKIGNFSMCPCMIALAYLSLHVLIFVVLDNIRNHLKTKLFKHVWLL